MKSIDELIHKLSQKPMAKEIFLTNLSKTKKMYESLELQIELMKVNGLPLECDEQNYFLKTSNTNIENQVFCIVDIETNGNTPENGQIIEIGAIKLQNGNIIDSYESFAYTKEIPEYISQVTGITAQMTRNSSPLKTVLEEFKIFLDNDVFVAHNVNFDYNFISKSLELYNLGELLNRKLCTIDLAKKIIQADKYGLESLKEILGIESVHHRAMNDAKSSMMILKHCINKLPDFVKTTEDLIRLSKK